MFIVPEVARILSALAQLGYAWGFQEWPMQTAKPAEVGKFFPGIRLPEKSNYFWCLLS
jgi:hypothetical protein